MRAFRRSLWLQPFVTPALPPTARGLIACALSACAVFAAVAPHPARAAAPSAPAASAPPADLAHLHVHQDVLVSKGAIPDAADAAPSDSPPLYTPAVTGQAVRDGQGVRTLRRSFAELDFRDKSVLRLNERTDVIVRDSPTLRSIHLESGAVWVRVAKGVHTQVETPSATAVARGTAFEVVQDADESGIGAMTLTVQEGHVDLTEGGVVVQTLGPGETIRLGRGGVPGDIEKAAKENLPRGNGAGGAGNTWYEQAAQAMGTTGLDTLAGAGGGAAGGAGAASGAGGAAKGAIVRSVGIAATTAGVAIKTAGVARTVASTAGGAAAATAAAHTAAHVAGGVVAVGAAHKAVGVAASGAGVAVSLLHLPSRHKGGGGGSSDKPADRSAEQKGPSGVTAGGGAAITTTAASGANSTTNAHGAASTVPEAGGNTPASGSGPALTLGTRPTAPTAVEGGDRTDTHTGLVIDARDLPGVRRSASPVIYGPAPDLEPIYPDPKHVPSPDEVQDESVVRYYRSEAEARKGFVGTNPLVIRAVAAVGPGGDCPCLSAEDTARVKALDRRIHFTLNWRVGILLPAGN